MSLKAILSVLSGLIFIYAFYPYLRAIVKGEARPKKATWMIWAVGDWIILAGMISKNTISGQLAGACLGATLTFILSLKYGEPGWERRDKVCITMAAVSIVMWQIFSNSNLGIAFSLLALSIAAWPTYVSAWHKPQNEDRTAWVWFNISSVLALLAIPREAFADIAPPVLFMLIDAPMLYLLFVRPKQRIFFRATGW